MEQAHSAYRAKGKIVEFLGGIAVLQVAWKLSNVKVRCADDNGKDDHSVTAAVAKAASKMLHAKKTVPVSAVTILRKAYDPRVGRNRQPGSFTTVPDPERACTEHQIVPYTIISTNIGRRDDNM